MKNVKEIETKPSEDGKFCYIDAKARSNRAVKKFPQFFNNADHIAAIGEVVTIVKNFFTSNEGIYINHRANKGKPFSVVKVQRPQFPNSMSQKQKDEKFYKPIEELGAEVVYAKGTDSWLVRVKK